MVSEGLTARAVGITDPSTTNRLGWPQTWQWSSTTLDEGSSPIGHPPSGWAVKDAPERPSVKPAGYESSAGA